jgi:hypothetical protein
MNYTCIASHVKTHSPWTTPALHHMCRVIAFLQLTSSATHSSRLSITSQHSLSVKHLAIMAAIFPAARQAKGGAKGSGRNSWSIGQKIWSNSLHQSSAAKPFLHVATLDDTSGLSSAAWEGLQKPAEWQAAEQLAKALTTHNCELLNRPGVGCSELGATLETLHRLIVEDTLDVFSKRLKKKWADLFEKHDVLNAAQLLNTQDYPSLDRSAASLTLAATNLLKLGNSIRTDWSDLVVVFAAVLGSSTGFQWVLQLAALTCPGAWPAGLKDVPNIPDAAKAKVLLTPNSGRALAELLAACTEELCSKRKAKAAPMVGGPVAALLSFSDDEQPAPAKKPKVLKHELRDLQAKLLDLSTIGISATKAAKILEQASGHMSAFNLAASQLTDGIPADVDLAALKAHMKALRKQEI